MNYDTDAMIRAESLHVVETSLERFQVPKSKKVRKAYGSVFVASHADKNQSVSELLSTTLRDDEIPPSETLWKTVEEEDILPSVSQSSLKNGLNYLSSDSDIYTKQKSVNSFHNQDEDWLSITKERPTCLDSTFEMDCPSRSQDDDSYKGIVGYDTEQGCSDRTKEVNKFPSGRRKKSTITLERAAFSRDKAISDAITPVDKGAPTIVDIPAGTQITISTAPKTNPNLDTPISEWNGVASQLSQTQTMTQTTDIQPDLDTLEPSIDLLFSHADKNSVTVRDIVTSLEMEFEVNFTKATKHLVRAHLKALMDGTVEVDGQGEETDKDDEVSDDGDEASEADFSSDENVPAKKHRSNKKSQVSFTSQTTRNTTSKKKTSAERIHADMQRKRRMEVLRVRNEELQAAESKEDIERAKEIAKVFDTNTDELRLKRLEDRLDLLEKLDQKRFQVIVKQGQVEDLAAQGKCTEEDSIEESTEASNDESDDELEIMGGLNTFENPKSDPKHTSKAIALLTTSVSMVPPMSKEISWSPSVSPGNSRFALRTMLQKKQRHLGNLWLARELGYKSEQEHLDDCRDVEDRKRLIVIALEAERQKKNERILLRERMLMQDVLVEGTEEQELDDGDEEYMPEGDDEFALHHVITLGGNEKREGHSNKSEVSDEDGLKTMVSMPSEKISVSPRRPDSMIDDEIAAPISCHLADDVHAVVLDGADGNVDCKDDDVDREETSVSGRSQDGEEKSEKFSTRIENTEFDVEDDDISTKLESGVLKENRITLSTTEDLSPMIAPIYGDHNEDVETTNESNSSGTTVNDSLANVNVERVKDRNAAWKALLQREARRAKNLKNRKGSELVDAEADEEEEEEIAGLEDFGFSLNKKKKDDDDDEDIHADVLDDEDLKHIVDEVSDDEGDEAAGNEARREMKHRDDKEQHKEMLRRMRDGYDGRRGGVAGGVGARGMHRFDQLVAADNREDAKRLGLLNDDEVDSEADEGEHPKESAEIDDENALLDKMLKDRFLHRSSVDAEETFSDDDEATQYETEEGKPSNDDDAEEVEQELLAKRFAKRARMQRLLESHGSEDEFSQMRLIDEDETMKIELKTMKDAFVRRRQTSWSKCFTSNCVTDSHVSVNSQNRDSHDSGGLYSQHTHLSLALQSSRREKHKTSFLGSINVVCKDNVSAMQRTVAYNHVVFHQENSQLSKSNISNNQGKRSTFSGKRKLPNPSSSSLWNKVSANSFKRHRN